MRPAGHASPEENDILYTYTKAKADLSNRQFHLKSPLSLVHLTQIMVQDLVADSKLPPNLATDSNLNFVPAIPEIDISINGLFKHLKT